MSVTTVISDEFDDELLAYPEFSYKSVSSAGLFLLINRSIAFWLKEGEVGAGFELIEDELEASDNSIGLELDFGK